MLLTQRIPTRTEHRRQVVRAAVVLARLVTDRRGWEADRAAGQLRHQLGDDRLIRLLRARVLDAMGDRPLPADRRALRTLDRALLEGSSRD